MRYLLIMFSMFLAVPYVAETKPHERKAIELNSHTEVLINLPAEQIWSYINEEPKAWKQGAQMVSITGSTGSKGKGGQKGEIFKAVMPAEPETVLFYAKNVELITNQRRTIKLYAGNDGDLIGFASWVLQAEGDKTRVSYHVNAETKLPDETWAQFNDEQRQAYTLQNQQTSHKRFQDELDSLKLLAEGASR